MSRAVMSWGRSDVATTGPVSVRSAIPVSEAASSIRAVFSPAQALKFLADAGAELTGSLDYEQTLRRVARLAVPDLADWCAVYISGAEGEEKEITSGHSDPEVEAELLTIRRQRRERGESESQSVARSTEARLATDVRVGGSSERSEGDRHIIERLDPTSYMVVPLIARGRSIGALTFLAAREGRHYTEQDLAFARTIAARCALAIDNARLYDAAERSLTLLDTVFATAPVGLCVIDRDFRFVRLNETLAALCSRSVPQCVGHRVEEVLGDRSDELITVCQRVIGSDEPVHNHLVQPTFSDDPAAAVWNVFAAPVHQPGGDLLGVTVVVVDVAERQRLLRAERAARIRADFLARAGELLDESLDYEETLRTVAEIAVPDVADWCALSVLDDAGALQEVTTAHVDPAQRELVDQLRRRFPPEPDVENAAARVVRTGQTEFVPEIRDEMLQAAISDPDRLALVRRLGLRSIITAALRARGRIFGTLTIANTAGNRTFDPDDVQLAEELARRSGLAVDNARLYTERTRIAQSLQARLLPGTLPEIPEAAVAARYRAAGEFNEVGGDFYDVFPRSATEWVMVVGDVSGKGPGAAAVTALARYTLRAGSTDDDDPAAALRRLNDAMRSDTHGRQFATAALAYVSVAEGRLTARLALAGHPPAMIIRQTGAVEAAGEFGTMLALRPDPTFPQTDVALEPGDVMLLYTDGVTEAGARTTPFGDTGYAELLGNLGGLTPEQVVDAVEHAVVELQGQSLRDDVALLAIAPITPPTRRR